MVIELRHVLNNKNLRLNYYAIFESCFCHISLALTQNINSVKMLNLLQKRYFNIMRFHSWRSRTSSLYRYFEKNLESFDNTALKFCIFISKSFKGLLLLLSAADAIFISISVSWFKRGNPDISTWLYVTMQVWTCGLVTKSTCSASCSWRWLCKTKIYGRYLVNINEVYICNPVKSCHQKYVLWIENKQSKRDLHYPIFEIDTVKILFTSKYKL